MAKENERVKGRFDLTVSGERVSEIFRMTLFTRKLLYK